MKYNDSVVILGVSFAAACFCEGVSWLLIYRTAGYKNLRSSIDKTTKKIDAIKNTAAAGAGKKTGKVKKMDRFENNLKGAKRDLMMSKFRSGAVVMVSLFLVFGLLSSLFDGKAVAKLPFEPVAFVQKMSHRGIPGDDATDCSMAFLYFLCSIAIRFNIQKLLGFAPPRGAAGSNFLTDAAKAA